MSRPAREGMPDGALLPTLRHHRLGRRHAFLAVVLGPVVYRGVTCKDVTEPERSVRHAA